MIATNVMKVRRAYDGFMISFPLYVGCGSIKVKDDEKRLNTSHTQNYIFVNSLSSELEHAKVYLFNRRFKLCVCVAYAQPSKVRFNPRLISQSLQFTKVTINSQYFQAKPRRCSYRVALSCSLVESTLPRLLMLEPICLTGPPLSFI